MWKYKYYEAYKEIVYDREKKEPKYVTLNKKKMIVNTSKIRVNSR